MKAVVRGLNQRSDSTVSAASISTASTIDSSTRPSRQDRRCPARASRLGRAVPIELGGAFEAPRRGDQHILHRCIAMTLALSGGNRGNAFDHIHALRDATKYCVAVPARSLIEEIVVGQIDEELRGGAVDFIGARHRQRAALIAHSVGGLVAHRRMGFLLCEIAGQSAALDHESRDDAMEDRAVEEAFIDVTEKILHRLRRILGVQLYGEGAMRGLEANHRLTPSVWLR